MDLLYALAIANDQLGRTNEALENLKKALALAPRDEDVLKSAGLLYLKTGNAELARFYLLKAATINPENDQTTLALGKAYFAEGDYANALNYFLKLKNQTLEGEDINYHIAMSYGRLNQMADFHYYFGLYLKKENKTQSALFHFRKAQEYTTEGTPRAAAIAAAIDELSADKRKKPDPKPPARQPAS